MTSNSLNYYGFDKDTYADCLDLIKSTDFRHMHILNLWFLGINVFFVICSYFNIFGLNRLKMGNYALFLGIAAIFEIKFMSVVLLSYELYLLFKRGDVGPNAYGEDPLS